MNQFPHMCGSGMMNNNVFVTLCEPLAQLKREHGPLREKMEQFAEDARKIGIGLEQTEADCTEPLNALKLKIDAFTQELDPHSDREEGTLFPMMAKYIGRETGPIAVMEYEHDQAKMNLKTFGELVMNESVPVETKRAKEIASYAIKAYTILTEHFFKEENILFPMAETILNDEDKETLKRELMKRQ